MLWKFQTQVTQGQVTRSRQVTSPQKKMKVRHSYTECPITLKLPVIDIRTSIYKIYLSEFRYPWPKVRSILRPVHNYKSMGKNERRLFWKETIWNTLKHRFTCRIDTLSWNIATSDLSPSRQSHFRSWNVISSFSAITFDRDQIEQWNHHRCVQNDHTDRVICSMIFSDKVMFLTWGQIFINTF